MKCFKYLLFLLIPASALSQDYQRFYAQMSTADSFNKCGKADSAIMIYETAFSVVEYVPTHYLMKVLKISESKSDESRANKYKKQIRNQLLGKNVYLKKIVDSLLKEDQRVRSSKYSKARSYVLKKRDTKCSSSKKFIKKQKLYSEWIKTDSSNAASLIALINENGFLGEELVGDAYHQVIVILLHFDRDTNNLILEPILKEVIKEGKILPLHAAFILDRHLYTHMGVQKYWTWNATKEGEPFPFLDSDVHEILLRREGVGIYGSGLRQVQKGNFWVIKNEFNF